VHENFLCQVPEKNTRQRGLFTKCIFLPSAFDLALGKELLCRVPEKKHSANHFALGKEWKSGSDLNLFQFVHVLVHQSAVSHGLEF
jgi:hypothetical protein